jgi:hypothetical protein
MKLAAIPSGLEGGDNRINLAKAKLTALCRFESYSYSKASNIDLFGAFLLNKVFEYFL